MVKRQPPSGITPQDWDATPNSVQTLVYTLLAAVEEMQQVGTRLQKQIEQQQKQIEQQQKRINQLEEQVGKNSRNSSKPLCWQPCSSSQISEGVGGLPNSSRKGKQRVLTDTHSLEWKAIKKVALPAKNLQIGPIFVPVRLKMG